MQCQWIKEGGTQCKANAKKGESYCGIHLKKARKVEEGSPAPSPIVEVYIAPAEEVEDVPSIHSNKPVRIRFTGKGSYSLPSKDLYFGEGTREATIEHDTWIYLLEQYPESFEEV